MTEQIEESHALKWYSLVNFIAGALLTLLGLVVRALEAKNFQLASIYSKFILVIFGMYCILRSDQLMDRILYIYTKYFRPKARALKDSS